MKKLTEDAITSLKNTQYRFSGISLLDFLKGHGHIVMDGNGVYYTFPNLICREEKGEVVCIENNLKNQ